MATPAPVTYLQQILAARTRIRDCFSHAHDLLTLRETNLLRELNVIQAKYEKDAISHQEELEDLKRSKQSLQNNLRDNNTLNKTLTAINEKMEQVLKLISTKQMICFQWNADFERDLKHAGEIITYTVSKPVLTKPVKSAIPDYKNKSTSFITCCKHMKFISNVPGELYYPRGLAIEPQTRRIYIADSNNNKVQVFSSIGEYSFVFNNKMNYPYGVCIDNNSVYISQFGNDCINLYKLDGTFIQTVGSRGSNKCQFLGPRGIAVNSNTGDLYVCDYTNHRIQIFNKSLRFQLIFGDNVLKHPRDVKVTAELVITLDENNPCIHVFNSYDHCLLYSCISRGEGKQIGLAKFFSIDKETNIILTDYGKHCVRIFNKSGDFISQFGTEGNSAGEFINPTGIIIDSDNRLVVVSMNANHALQMFESN